MDPGFIALIILLLVESFGPGIIAIYCNHRRKYLITIVSLLIGWTQIGAIVMFIIALKGSKLWLSLEEKIKLTDKLKNQQKVDSSKLKNQQKVDSSKLINCKSCKKKIAEDALRCPRCGAETTHSFMLEWGGIIIFVIGCYILRDEIKLLIHKLMQIRVIVF